MRPGRQRRRRKRRAIFRLRTILVNNGFAVGGADASRLRETAIGFSRSLREQQRLNGLSPAFDARIRGLGLSTITSGYLIAREMLIATVDELAAEIG